MEQGAHIRRTAQAVTIEPNTPPRNGDRPHFLKRLPQTRPSNTKETGAPTGWSDPSIVHCITGTLFATPGHTSTQPPPKQKPRSEIAAKRDQTCDTTRPHSVCSNTLIVTRVTCAPNVTGASWQGIPCHDGPSMRARRPLLIGNIPTDGATPLRAAAKL